MVNPPIEHEPMPDEFDLPSVEQRTLEEKLADAWTAFYYEDNVRPIWRNRYEAEAWGKLRDLLEELRDRTEAVRAGWPDNER